MLMLLRLRKATESASIACASFPFQIIADADPDYRHVPVVTVVGRGFNFALLFQALLALRSKDIRHRLWLARCCRLGRRRRASAAKHGCNRS